jgi:DNA replication licensing factor MCM4
LKELFAARRGTRMAVRDITTQLSEILNNSVEQSDIIEALGQMEGNGVIQFNERAQTVYVRAGVVSN